MLTSLITCPHFLTRLNSLINKLYRPNPKYTPNQVDQELDLIRHKGILLIHAICFWVFILDIFVNGSPVIGCLFRASLCPLVAFLLYISCQHHPQIFKVLYNILVCGVYGPLMMRSGEGGIHAAWEMSSVLPAFVFVFLGSFKHFLFQAVLQLIFVNTIFTPELKDVAMELPSENFTAALKQAHNSVLVTHSIIVLLMDYIMNQATKRVLITEKRTKEVETQKTFLYSFSHELRNLINSLSGNVKLAAMDDNISERVKELLSNAETCGEMLQYLVNNILDTGKEEVGELEVDLKPTKIYGSLEKIWGICSELIKKKDLQGKMKIQKDLPRTLLTDHYRLAQIFINIIGNAIKFTEKGGVNLSVEWMKDCQEVTDKCFEPYPFNEEDDQDEGLFEKFQDFSLLSDEFVVLDTYHRKKLKKYKNLTNRANKGVLKVAITDTGCGMTKEQSSQLFKKFTQVTSDASKRKLGTGLGLFIIKQLCNRMNGDVRVFSQKDKGSCFVFCLPVNTVQEEAQNPNNMEPLRNVINQKKLTAMMFDKSAFDSLILTSYFQKLEVEVLARLDNENEAYDKYIQLTRAGSRTKYHRNRV